MGRSDKVTEEKDYTLELHMATFRSFMKELGLRGVTLVVQDWYVGPFIEQFCSYGNLLKQRTADLL